MRLFGYLPAGTGLGFGGVLALTVLWPLEQYMQRREVALMQERLARLKSDIDKEIDLDQHP